jgi:hypothetical protein
MALFLTASFLLLSDRETYVTGRSLSVNQSRSQLDLLSEAHSFERGGFVISVPARRHRQTTETSCARTKIRPEKIISYKSSLISANHPLSAIPYSAAIFIALGLWWHQKQTPVGFVTRCCHVLSESSSQHGSPLNDDTESS